MAFDFPNTPSVGDLFQDSSSGAVYRWNGYAWIGGVTGIGLQTVKETRYLTAGSFTHTRDPKSSGFADIYYCGAMGGHVSVGWASGQIVITGSGGGAAYSIKWKYPLPASAAVIVGASSPGSQSGSSSFDGVLVAAGGMQGLGASAAGATANQVGGGSSIAAGTSGDENYNGSPGVNGTSISGIVNYPAGPFYWIRGCRRGASPGAGSASANIPAATGDAGAVIVVEYLNP